MTPPHLHVQLLDTNGHPMSPVFACGQLVIVGCMEGNGGDPDDVALDINAHDDHVHVRIVSADDAAHDHVETLQPVTTLAAGPFCLPAQHHRKEYPHA